LTEDGVTVLADLDLAPEGRGTWLDLVELFDRTERTGENGHEFILRL
jgi:hypothetical protein